MSSTQQHNNYELCERDFRGFEEAPRNAYGEESLYVAPLNTDLKRFLSLENPLFKGEDDFSFFCVRKNGTPIGRITAHHHLQSNELHNLNWGYFGYFDCADDDRAAGLLLGAAEAWCRRRGYQSIVGNFNLTAMHQIGVLTGGFDAVPYSDQVYGAAHLPKLLKAQGYLPEFPMTTYELNLGSHLEPNVVEPQLRFDTLRKKAIKEQMEHTREVLNDGFKNNPYFVPLTSEEFLFQAADLTMVIDERISCIAYDGDRPVGVVVCIPDINPLLRSMKSRMGWRSPWAFLKHRLNRKRAVVIFYSVCESHHGQGINRAMLSRVVTALKGAKYESLGVTWISDSNPASLRSVEKWGAKPLHRLHLFKKALVES